MYTIFCDGASKQNPGESGVGIIINKEGNTISKIGEYIGKHTNNVAEYISVIRALTELIELSKSDLNVLTSKIILATDSLLVIKQLNQEWKIKQPQLQYLYDVAKKIISENNFNISFIWVPRTENSKADELANVGISKKIAAHNSIHSVLDNLNTKQINNNNNNNNNNNSVNNLTNKKSQDKDSSNGNSSINQILIAERIFFSKTSCLKFQISKRRDVYIHIGSLKEKQWEWKIVKFNDMELSEMLFILEGKKDKCAFFHSNSHKGANTKTQIWCTSNEKGFSIKIQDFSKLLSLPEARVLQELIRRSIWEINKI